VKELIFGAVVAVIIGAIPATAVWACRRYSRRVRAVPGDVFRAVGRRRDATRQRRQLADAVASGDVILVAAVGVNPTRVTWAGAADQTTFEYDDLGIYKRDMRAGRVPPARAFCCGRGRRVGTRRKVPGAA